MKKLIYIYIVSSILILFSCTDDFSDINTNPNAPIQVESSFLLRQVIYDFGEQMSYEGFVAGNLLGQYFTAVDFNLFDRHSLSEPQFGGNPWPILYTNLRNVEIILDQSSRNPVDAVYQGPAMILKAHYTGVLTDIFGDVPYTEALNGLEGNVTPQYDLQEDIYMADGGILDLLEKGIEAIEGYDGVARLEGDILYGGDLEKWIQFAQSLRLKYLMRISNKVNVSIEVSELYFDGIYIKENSDNATFDFDDTPPNNFRLSTARIGDFNIYIMSETIQEILNTTNDPRVATFFRPVESAPSTYQGLLNGPNAAETSISIADYSLTGRIFREETGRLDANFMTAWETSFLLAEAAHRGLIFANPKDLYETGVRQAFEYWQTDLPDNYLSGSAAYDAVSDPLEAIITQRWIASILNGYEGWTLYRRTGYPALKTVAASLNNDLIPNRMPYPTDEEALNGINYQKAAELSNGNSINHKVWWQE